MFFPDGVDDWPKERAVLLRANLKSAWRSPSIFSPLA